jgi:hypothetical protein
MKTSRVPQFLDNLLTDSSEVASLVHWPPFTPKRFLVLISVRGCQTQGHSVAGRIRSIEKSNDLFGNQTCDLPACSIRPQPTTLPQAPLCNGIHYINIIPTHAHTQKNSPGKSKILCSTKMKYCNENLLRKQTQLKCMDFFRLLGGGVYFSPSKFGPNSSALPLICG